MRGPFCAVCGKDGEFPNNVCPECAALDETKSSLVREKEPKVRLKCKSCKRVLIKKRWIAIDKFEKFPGGIIKKALCPDCYKESVEHYTTILKFQGLTPDRESLVRRTIDNVLEEERSREKRTAMTKIDEKAHHFYFTHLATARAIVKRLAHSEKIQSREDESLIGFDHAAGKGKYRVSVLVRFLSGAEPLKEEKGDPET
jgi:NMD protein affecting ribosome stability and mRNA decay